ncbi:MAG: AstB/chuR-related protein [Caulobacter sp.]|nr:AstB/chuR-related protein [Caulobacter sp.]
MTERDRSPIRLAGGAISIIGTCNLACKSCYSSSSPSVTSIYSIEQLSKLLVAFRGLGIAHLFIGGGEPLLHPQLLELIGLARAHGMSISLSTNGHLLNEQFVDALFRAGVRQDVSVSLDGPDENINSRTRGRDAFLPAIRGMYHLARDGRIIWGVNFVSSKLNLSAALDTANLAKRVGASYFNLVRFSYSGRGAAFAEPLGLDEVDFQAERDLLSGSYKEFGSFYGDIFLYDLADVLSSGAQSYFNRPTFDDIPSGLSIDPEGNIELTPAKVSLGNILSEPLDAVLARLHSEEVLAAYEAWLLGHRRGVHSPHGERGRLLPRERRPNHKLQSSPLPI